MNVIPLRSKDVTPEMVLTNVNENLANIREIYVVAIGIDGKPVMWASGDLSDLCFAVTALQSLALSFVNGDVEDER